MGNYEQLEIATTGVDYGVTTSDKDSRAVVGLSASVQESVSVGVGVPRPVKDPSCRGEETVHVVAGFGPDGPQPPARGENDKKSVTRMGGVCRNSTCTPQGPGAVQVWKGWKVAARLNN